MALGNSTPSAIKLCFFASLRDQLGCADMQLPLPDLDAGALDITAVFRELLRIRPQWESVFHSKNILTAVNHTMASWTTLVHAGDEVAFFPPVTGG